ncbi:MAG: putative glycoside hydrolase [Pygmaiobacter sp.]|nr:putative glycoside hydrolase [Pygmaiobacter sp.]
MKKSRPVKIKRYRRSFSGSGAKKNLARRILLWVVILGAVFGIGWLVAKPGLDLASGLWYRYKNGGGAPSSQAANSTPAASSSQPQPASTETPQPTPAPAANGMGGWAMVALSEADTPEKATALAAQLQAQGVTYVVLPLKDDRGYLYYNSALPLAQKSIAATTVDAAAIASALRNAGVTPVAGLCAFKDSLVPFVDRTTAVKYNNQDITWLDTSKELGGKAWLNPNSPVAQQYITDLIGEVKGLGFDTVLLQNLQFPEGTGLNLASYGAMAGTKEQLLAQLGQQYQGIDGVSVWFEFPAAAVRGEMASSYGASPATFGLQRVFVRLDDAALSDSTGLAGLLSPFVSGGATGFGVRGVSGSTPEALAVVNDAAKQAGFTSYFVIP